MRILDPGQLSYKIVVGKVPSLNAFYASKHWTARVKAKELASKEVDALGALKVTSAYRSPAVNAKVGGAKTSQHTQGQAADLKFDGGNEVLFNWIKDNLDFDQLI